MREALPGSAASSNDEVGTVRGAIEKLNGWLKANAFQGYEPFDGLNGWLRPFAIGKLGRQSVVQLVKRCPWNLRAFFGIQPVTSARAMGYFARGFLKLYQATGLDSYLRRAQGCLRWLENHSSPGYSGLCWGNHYDYQTRLYYLPKGGPTIPWTTLNGHAFLDLYSLTKQPECVPAIESIACHIIEDQERRQEPEGTCLSYNPAGYFPVHNANMLAAGFLARAGVLTGHSEYLDIARPLVSYAVKCQLADGGWWYGQAQDTRWVDNWHTAYVLDSLWHYHEASPDPVAFESLRRGCDFWINHFFLADGTPKFYWDKTYPIDIQCASQAIESLCLLCGLLGGSGRSLARRVADWTISHMQHEDGHFCYQVTRWGRNVTPMLHWGQATMFHALGSLLLLESKAEGAGAATLPSGEAVLGGA